jgi:hypothetical protein
MTTGDPEFQPLAMVDEMEYWARIAAARGLQLTEQDLDRLTQALAGLEQVFRPLIQQLTPEMEPDVELQLGEEGE